MNKKTFLIVAALVLSLSTGVGVFASTQTNKKTDAVSTTPVNSSQHMENAEKKEYSEDVLIRLREVWPGVSDEILIKAAIEIEENRKITVERLREDENCAGWSDEKLNNSVAWEYYTPELMDIRFATYCGKNIVRDNSVTISDIPVVSVNELFDRIGEQWDLGRDHSYQTKKSGMVYLVKTASSGQNNIPDPAVREKEDASRYIMFDIDGGGRAFFLLSKNHSRSGIPLAVGFPIIYKNKLSYSAFAGLKIGDTLSDVEVIDDVCGYYRDVWTKMNEWITEKEGTTPSDYFKAFNSLNYWGESNAFSTIHYLTDGLLRIEYGDINEEGDPVISNIRYFPEYIMNSGVGEPLDYKINPLDLPESK